MGTTQAAFLGTVNDELGTAIHNLTWDEYRAVRRVNPSTIVYGMESRKHLLYAMTGPGMEPSNDMRLGTGIHALTLEPHTFKRDFAVIPPFHLDPENCTQNGKESKATTTSYCQGKIREFLEANPGKTVLTDEQYQRALKAVIALHANPRASELVKTSIPEITVTGVIEGIRFKGRIDLLQTDTIGDIKTTVTADPWKFSVQFRNLRYAHKLSIYRELVRQSLGRSLEVEIIAQEKKPPFDAVVFPVPADKLDEAFAEVCSTILDYRLAMETNHWPGRDKGELTVSLLDIAFGGRAGQDDGAAYDWDADEVSDEDLASGDEL